MLLQTSLPRAATGCASASSPTAARRDQQPAPHGLRPRGAVERRQQLGKDEVELHLADPAVEVAHQAQALAVFGQPRAQVDVGGVEVDHRQRPLGLGDRVLAEEEVDADQLGEVAEVGEPLGRQQDRRVHRAAEPHQAVQQQPALRGGQQKPRLVQQHDLVSIAVRADEAQSFRRDQGERRHGDALGAGVGLAGGAGVGQREARRADRDHRGARSGGVLVASAPSSAKPRRARPKSERTSSASAASRPASLALRRRRSTTWLKAPLPRPHRVAHGAVDRVLPGGRRVAQQLQQVAGGQLLAQLGQADPRAGRACRGGAGRRRAPAPRPGPPARARPRGCGRAWGRR